MQRIGLQPYLLLTSSSVPTHQSLLLLKAISYSTRKAVVTGQVRKLEALVHCVFWVLSSCHRCPITVISWGIMISWYLHTQEIAFSKFNVSPEAFLQAGWADITQSRWGPLWQGPIRGARSGPFCLLAHHLSCFSSSVEDFQTLLIMLAFNRPLPSYCSGEQPQQTSASLPVQATGLLAVRIFTFP